MLPEIFLVVGNYIICDSCLQGEKRKEPFMLYTESPTGSLLRKKIDEFNSTTTGLIMTMVNILHCQVFVYGET